MAVAKAKAKKPSKLVTIDRGWQGAFIVAMAFAQIVSIATVLVGFLRLSHYVSSGTWTFQVVGWLYPLLYLGVAYLFVSRRISGNYPRLFWAMFIATMGVIVYGALQGLLTMMFSVFNWWPQVTSADRSWWTAFGVYWSQMAAIFGLYCLVLWVISRERKRT